MRSPIFKRITGWTRLGSANDISADGNTIVGAGSRNNTVEAFIAVLNVVPEPSLMGDFDGDVDAADLLEWQGDFGQHADSDADNDDDSDGADFLAWQQQLGSAAAVAASSAVPEPATLILLVSGARVIFPRRRVTVS